MLECSGDTRASTRKVAPIMDTSEKMKSKLNIIISCRPTSRGIAVDLDCNRSFAPGAYIWLTFTEGMSHSNEKDLAQVDKEHAQVMRGIMNKVSDCDCVNRKSDIRFKDSRFNVTIGSAYDLGESLRKIVLAITDVLDVDSKDVSVAFSPMSYYHVDTERILLQDGPGAQTASKS